MIVHTYAVRHTGETRIYVACDDSGAEQSARHAI